MKPCPKCGEQIKDTLNFCVYCGCNVAQEEAKAKAKFCGECGAQIEDGMKFCGECGAKVESESPSKQHDDPWFDVDEAGLWPVEEGDESYDPWADLMQEQKPQKQIKTTGKKVKQKPADKDVFDPSKRALDKLKKQQGDGFDFDELFGDLGFKDDEAFWREKKQENGKTKHWVEDCLASGKNAEAKENYAEAMSWYQSAAEEDNVEAMGHIGRFYRNGLGVEQDYAKAINWYKQAALGYDAQSIADLGWMYYHGQGVKKDLKKAFEYFDDAGRRDNIDGLINSAYCRRNGVGTDVDKEGAYINYERAAMLGHANSQNEIGIAYYLGEYERKYKDVYDKVGEPDYVNAEFWFDRSAQQGNVNAMYNLGVMYYNGFGRRKSPEEEVNLFTFDNLPIGTPNYQHAFYWFDKAAQNGNISALNYLFVMYREGAGVKQDDKKAFECAKQAAEKGADSSTKKWLAWFYENGVGTKKDIKKAKEWYKKAADEGCAESKQRLKALG